MITLKKVANNFHRVEIENEKELVILFFSYETMIGFRYNEDLYVSKNYWSNSTAKHIAMIESDKKKLLDTNVFKLAQAKFLKGIV